MASPKYFMISFFLFIISVISYTTQAQRLSAGAGFAVFLCDDGKPYSTGVNFLGQLGQHDSIEQSTLFQPLKGIDSIIALSSGADHTLALRNDGTVWAWGGNGKLQLGDGTSKNQFSPVQVDSLKDVVKISAGWWHSLFLKSDGTVWGVGANQNGELGQNPPPYGISPARKIPGLHSIKEVAGGHSFSLALDSSGHVYVFGVNQRGQLGLGHTQSKTQPTKINSLDSIAKVFAGWSSAFAIDQKGQVWSWGSNRVGQLGLAQPTGNFAFNTTPSKINFKDSIKKITSSRHNVLALTYNGKVYGWGQNSFWQLADSSKKNVNYPLKIDSLPKISDIVLSTGSAFAISKKGTILSWGQGVLGSDSVQRKVKPSPVNFFNCQKLLSSEEGDIHSLNEINGSLFPNPTSARFTLQTGSPVQQVKLLHVNGQVLRSWPAQNSYNIAHLPSGLYLLKVITEEGSRVSKIWKR